MVADFIVVEGMKRVTQFQHDVIRNVNDIADGRNAGSFEPVFQPFRRRLNLHVSNHARGEAPTELRRLDLDFHGVAGPGCAFRRLRRNMLQREFINRADFACDSIMAEAIGTIRTDFGVNHRTVRTVFDATDVGSGKGKARRKLLRRRRNGDEFLEPVVNDLHDSVPAACSCPK